MTLFTYDNTVPAANDDPSDDQPVMLSNTEQSELIWNVDHVGFNAANGGTHNQVTLQQQGVDPSVSTGALLLFSKAASSEPTLFMRQQTNGSVVQLGGKTPSIGINGFTFIPGGLFLQWGTGGSVGTDTAVTFPTPFTTVYSITATSTTGNATTPTYSIVSPSASGFTARSSNAGASFYWMAIGTTT